MKRLVITEVAEKDLVNIETYLQSFQPKEKVKSTFDSIFEKLDLLVNFPQMGQIDIFLQQKKGKDFRYVLSKPYKIIYSLENQDIVVHRVFDTRQNPKKLKI